MSASPATVLLERDRTGAATPRLVAGTDAPALTVACRALIVLFGIGLSVGLAAGVLLLKDPLYDYLTRNEMRPQVRIFVLGAGIGSAGLTEICALFFAWSARRRARVAHTLDRVSRRLAPLGVAAFLPLLFQWKAWKDHDLSFLALVTLASFVLEAGLRAAITVGPLGLEVLLRRRGRLIAQALSDRLPRAGARAPLLVVIAAATAYSLYFSYRTLAWHRGLHSSYDLGLENNLMWNLIHGNQFFKSSPLVGPTGTHFGYHATLFALLMAPVYALFPRAEFLLVVQSLFLGFASIPLFLWARLRLSAWLSCAVALAYLLYPCVHNANLYEFHYLPLGTFFLWLVVYAVEAKRRVLAIVAVIVTLMVREDVSAMLAVIGAYLLISGRSPRAGLAIAAAGSIYFVTLKMFVMPRFVGTESFTFMFDKLLPVGENSFGGVLKTAVGNPWYTIGTLLEENKLVYLLQILTPLAFIPMRRPLSLLLGLPGFLFTLLSTGYSPTISIHYQYTTYWTTFLFLGLVLVLAHMNRVRRGAAMGALGLSLFATSYQYGAILQTNTLFGGPIPYKFGTNREDKRRHEAFVAVNAQLPPHAKVAGCGFITPQISSREDAYSLTLGMYDAEYVFCPSERPDFIVDEREKLMMVLANKTFGVVAIEPPFSLVRRGASTARNDELLARIR